jgi:hypothetical protein
MKIDAMIEVYTQKQNKTKQNKTKQKRLMRFNACLKYQTQILNSNTYVQAM